MLDFLLILVPLIFGGLHWWSQTRLYERGSMLLPPEEEEELRDKFPQRAVLIVWTPQLRSQAILCLIMVAPLAVKAYRREMGAAIGWAIVCLVNVFILYAILRRSTVRRGA